MPIRIPRNYGATGVEANEPQYRAEPVACLSGPSVPAGDICYPRDVGIEDMLSRIDPADEFRILVEKGL